MHKKLFLLSLITALVCGGCSIFKTSTVSQSSPTPQTSPTPTITASDIRTLIDTGAKARESGDYQTGEAKLSQAFQDAVALKDKALTIEAGNNLSIQYRLSAGRANRNGKTTDAQNYSQKSLAVYQQLKDLGWFDLNDLNIVRNWGHALLYAGKAEQAIPVLKASFQTQTNLAAQGDECDHMNAAYQVLGRLTGTADVFDKCLHIIQQNNGSPVWLTFGMEAKATWLAKRGRTAAAKQVLQQALTIAQQKNLVVRQEEIHYLLAQPANKIDVMQAVGTPAQ